MDFNDDGLIDPNLEPLLEENSMSDNEVDTIDLTLREHLQRINEKQLDQHYLSHDIQNELITFMSKSVTDEIIQRVKQAKYYAILLNCTRDVSRVEQMSIILRFCNTSTGAIEEHFVGFISVAETTGEYLTNTKLQELDRNGLDIQNCRGQGYDNGANMVGINKGVRTRILNINPRAFFTPCGCHSWNLLLIDAANSSTIAKTFFGFINKIYVLFSKSSKRWDLVKTKLKLTLKFLSETRWESRIGAVKAIFVQFDDVIECVNDVKIKNGDSETLSDCEAVLKEMLTFEFIVAIHVWYEILLRVNNISKLWQSVQVNLKVAIDTLHSFCSWIREFRNTGFEKTIAGARLCIEKSSYEIATEFKEKRIAKKKRLFAYEHIDETIESVEMQYRVNFFNSMTDAIIVDTECRFKVLNEYYEQFGFIYDLNYLKSIPKEDLLKHCNDLGTILREDENSDIQPYELYEELQLLKSHSLDSVKDAKQLIQYILKNNLEEVYPNVYITIRIMLTVPVSTASAERSFSKLKLIKTYL
ncbi:Zinc finger MYM-type protein 1 [Eumeta japonica]|uniref:Zinc finger MYM-type protein 1 n=1 Tax=Eumeta variegata TaxID=151549 RepID=A0A4C1WK80_EUMVA|nr:Zinc finger MYM-type protein 1 [Eumeta japonica]